MACRIGYTLKSLQRMDAAACSDDARLVWKDGDSWNMGIVMRCDAFLQGLNVSGPRELRLLGLQMIARAKELESDEHEHEVVLP